MNYTTIYTKEPEWGYTVEVLELPGCLTYGESLEEAEEMIKDAIKAYLISVKKHWESIDNINKTKFISSLIINETVQA